MNTDKFIETMLPSIAKETILEDCRTTIKELKEFVIPSYKSAMVFFKTHSFENEESNQVAQGLKSVIGNKNMVVAIGEALPVVEENVAELMDIVEKTYGDVLASGGMTYAQGTVVQLIEYSAFFSRYARRLLGYLTVLESAMIEGSGVTRESINDSIPPAEQKWIKGNLSNFAEIFSIVTTERIKLRKSIDTIPDIQVTKDNYRTLEQTLGANKLDPFKTRFIPTWVNPFYHIGLIVAEWQAERYNTAKKDKELAELRLMNLQLISKGKPDARVQKEITYLENYVQKQERRIHEMEVDYA